MDIETNNTEFKSILSKGFTSEVVAFLNYNIGGVIYSFEFFDNYLTVKFKYKENPFEYKKENDTINDIINDTINNMIKLSNKEEMVLNIIVKNPYVTRDKIVKELNISDRTVSRILKRFQDENIIIRDGSKKTGFWKIIERKDK